MYRPLIALCFTLIAAPALAEDAPPAECRSPVTHPDMMECNRALLVRAEERMKAALQALRDEAAEGDPAKRAVSVPSDEAILADQAAWEAEVEADCQASAAELGGGQASDLEYLGCLGLKTGEREAELLDLTERVEGLH
ncbi:lysozyme inhibitor LprI family protein [Frigidibacter sp. RF13]|uniref:lysozyme inhibitor LprI family protein n=1 Tax=Frigidibacter sp. RF13 TaxID=2997340 RepID=UPI002271A70A|nr:lysozyme inhibitor LprI family protein [Frigidibacter sp. RF13]MCY1125839.1 lysozyme inhibitor LprI family protein [Frigidibacter sp. RF13]